MSDDEEVQQVEEVEGESTETPNAETPPAEQVVEPVVEPQEAPPAQPTYSVAELQALTQRALAQANLQRENAEFQERLDKLYAEDPVEYARLRKEKDDLDKERSTLAQDVSTEYYTNLFQGIAAEKGEILRNMSPAMKAELDPTNPKYTSDSQYLNALTSAIAREEAKVLAAQEVARREATNQSSMQEVAQANAQAQTTPNLPPAQASERANKNYLTMSSREGLADALKSVVGAGLAEDDSD